MGKPSDLQCRLSVYLQNRLVLYNFLIYKHKELELLWPNLTLFCVWAGPPRVDLCKSPPPSLCRSVKQTNVIVFYVDLSRLESVRRCGCFIGVTLTINTGRLRDSQKVNPSLLYGYLLKKRLAIIKLDMVIICQRGQ